MRGFVNCEMCEGSGVVEFPVDGCKDAEGTRIVSTISFECRRTPRTQEALKRNASTIHTKQVWMASR